MRDVSPSQGLLQSASLSCMPGSETILEAICSSTQYCLLQPIGNAITGIFAYYVVLSV